MDFLEQINLHYEYHFKELNIIRDWIGQVYEVINENKKYIVKLFRREHTRQALQSIEVMAYLKDSNLPVPAIITTLKGDKYFIYNDQVVVLYEYIVGECMDGSHRLLEVAKLSGWLRKSMESYTKTVTFHGYDFFIKRYLNIMKMKEYPGINKFSELGHRLWEEVKNLPSGFIHGDFHSGNMFQNKDNIIVFDFDACAIASPVYDIATYCDATDYFDLSADNFENGFVQTRENVTEFLKGYKTYFNLNKEEEKAIYPFIAIRHFDIQATIISSRGLTCVDGQFLDNQYTWLKQWMEQFI